MCQIKPAFSLHCYDDVVVFENVDWKVLDNEQNGDGRIWGKFEHMVVVDRGVQEMTTMSCGEAKSAPINTSEASTE
ncbi:hypothetical protein ES702_00521 [subsurface metagenome]